jgi:hypothetical protein
MRGGEGRIIAPNLTSRVLSVREKKQVVNRDNLRSSAGRHQERMRRVCDVDIACQHFRGRPLEPMPYVIQNANRDAPIDYSSTGLVGDISCRSIFPGAREEENLIAIRRRIRARQLMNVLADTGTRPQGGPVIDEDAHDGRVQSQATETQNG